MNVGIRRNVRIIEGVDRWQHQIESAGARHGLSSANVQTQLQREVRFLSHSFH